MGSTQIDLICQEGGKSKTGFALRRELSSGERILRSFRSIAILWAIAFFCIFIPMLHFILVPLFLFLGVAFGIATWLQKSLVLSGETVCPNCDNKIQMQETAESWPREQRCTSCYLTLNIRPS